MFRTVIWKDASSNRDFEQTMKKTILAANWKMYLNENESVDFINRINQEESSFSNANVILFPSHTCINQVQKNLKSNNNKITETAILAADSKKDVKKQGGSSNFL